MGRCFVPSLNSLMLTSNSCIFSKVLPLCLLQLLQIKGVQNRADPKAKGKIRPWQRGLIPLHLHARQLTLPKLYRGNDIIIKAPLPEYFEGTLQKLNLHPKRKNMTHSKDLIEYYRLKQLKKPKGVGF